MLDANVPLDLNVMSKAELEALKRQVEDALSKVDERRRQEAIRAAKQSVEEFGFSLEEILAFASGSGRKRASSERNDGVPKFRNPENPQETWSGRGRRPLWLNRQIEAGRSQDEFRA